MSDMDTVDRMLDGSDNDFGPSARSAKWGKERRNDRCRQGAVEKGFIVEDPFPCQQREFKADQTLGELKFWNKPGTKIPDPDKPMMQLKVIIQTDWRDDDEDDGRRAIYLKGELLKEVKAVLKEQGSKLRKGGWLAVQCTGTYVNNNGFDTYSWAVKYKAPVEEFGADFGDMEPPASTNHRGKPQSASPPDWAEAEPQNVPAAKSAPQSTLSQIRANTPGHQAKLKQNAGFEDEPPF